MNEHYGKILAEGSGWIVVKKQSGVPVEAAGVKRDLFTELKEEMLRQGKTPELYLIHRLDQGVEGLLVFGTEKEAAAKLSAQLKDKEMNKEYLAVIHGVMEPEEGDLIDHLGKQGRTAFVEPTEKEWTKEARLSYTTAAKQEDTSLLRIALTTGRFHQIRVQLSHAGHPIVGDKKYGNETESEKTYPALCAFRLSFTDPGSGEEKSFRIAPENEAFLPYQKEIENL